MCTRMDPTIRALAGVQLTVLGAVPTVLFFRENPQLFLVGVLLILAGTYIVGTAVLSER